MLDLKQARTIFDRLEAERDTEYENDPPTYKVRLDAGRSGGERDYRVFVTADFTRDSMLYVLEVVGEVAPEAWVDVENAGIAIF